MSTQKTQPALNAIAGILLAASALSGAANTATAADLVAKARPAPRHDPCGAERFGGFYVGGNAGVVANTATRTDLDGFLVERSADFSANKIGATAGVQAGYDWQSCNKVLGIVADWSWTDTAATARLDPSGSFSEDTSIHSKMRWFSTIRARAGLAVNDTLLYVTGGLAIADIKTALNVVQGVFARDEHVALGGTRLGFVGGVGAEFAIRDNWSVNAELLYMQFRKDTASFFYVPTQDTLKVASNDQAWIGRVGLNYRWDNPRVSHAAASAGVTAAFDPCGSSRFNGGYIGGNVGGVSYTALRRDQDGFTSGGDSSATGAGFTAGAQLGWDWQSCNKLFGVVADWNWTNADATARQGPHNVTAIDHSTSGSMDWFSTIRGRAGLVVDDALIYVTGGVAAAKIGSTISNLNTNGGDALFHFSDTRWGVAGGVGAEFALHSNWSLNTELLYMQFKKNTDTGVLTFPGGQDSMTFENHDSAWVSRVGLNYRWDNPGSVYAAKTRGTDAMPCGPARFQGGYVGGNAGAIRHTSLSHDQDGYLGGDTEYTATGGGLSAGVQAGYDWQSCHKVFGVVADGSWAGTNTHTQLFQHLEDSDVSMRSKMDWFSTVRARTGLAMNDTLIYITGGLAAAKVKSDVTLIAPSVLLNEQQFSFSDVRFGWTGGVGTEFALANGWSVNGEVLYMQFAKDTHTLVSPSNGNRTFGFEAYDSAWIGRAGLNYRFGAGS